MSPPPEEVLTIYNVDAVVKNMLELVLPDWEVYVHRHDAMDIHGRAEVSVFFLTFKRANIIIKLGQMPSAEWMSEAAPNIKINWGYEEEETLIGCIAQVAVWIQQLH